MNYAETLDYLYNSLPMFQKVGGAAFNKSLDKTIAFCKALDDPQKKFPSVHVAGTNGKGSVSHFIAAILQAAGYRTGLYTSPHLKNFTERIRVDGKEMPEAAVVDFVEKSREAIEELKPSFFETTVAMAFDHFASEQVDIAVVETGMGGRLDSTNVLQPVLSVITGIGYDHQQFLGETLPLIAAEKAGIIKNNTPVVISEDQPEVLPVFEKTASEQSASLMKAFEHYQVIKNGSGSYFTVKSPDRGELDFISGLSGRYQEKNIPAVFAAVDLLREKDFEISEFDLMEGLEHVGVLTGIRGRWEILRNFPKVIVDTGHNISGLTFVVEQLKNERYDHLHIVFGTVKDKEMEGILELLPANADYYFCAPDLARALPAEELKNLAAAYGLSGKTYPGVKAAYEAALHKAGEKGLVFVGGSTFVVGEVL